MLIFCIFYVIIVLCNYSVIDSTQSRFFNVFPADFGIENELFKGSLFPYFWKMGENNEQSLL